MARSLERDWNEKLNILDELQRNQASQVPSTFQAMDETEKEQILQLVQDFPTLWLAPTTTFAERKEIVRLLIKDVTLLGSERSIQIGIRWQSGVLSDLQIPRGTFRTSNTIIEQIRALVQTRANDEQIALTLNQAGFTTARRHPFTANRVKELRRDYHIPRGDSRRPTAYPSGQRADGFYTVRKASEILNWSISTIHKWCRQGLLEFQQDLPHAPVWVRLDVQKIAELRNPDNPWDPNLV